MNNKTGLLLIFVLFPWWLLAQEMKIKGNVKDDEGLGMLGVSVVVKGTTRGVATDNHGNFELKVGRNDVLVFSSMGYTTQEVKVGKQTNLKVVMLPEVEELVGIEKVAVAYGTADKKSFTGSMTTVKAEEIQNKQTTDVAKALEGSVSGVQISTSTGQPGADSEIRIRGIGSINGSSQPLIILDGVPFSGNLSAINNNDIESVNVLKDAASAALYGARGANGVVIITTKSGARGKLSIHVDTRTGFNYRAIPEYDILKSPAEYYETYWNALYNDNYFQARGGGNAAAAAAYASESLIENLGSNYNIYDVPDEQLVGADGKLNPQARLKPNYTNPNFNNWEKALFNSRVRKEHNLSLTKGTEFNSFFFSLGYLGDEGYNLNSYFNRYTTRFAYKGEITPWLKVNASTLLTHTQRQGEERKNAYSNPFSWTRNMAPIYPIYKEGDRSKGYDYGEARAYLSNENPVGTQNADLDLRKSYYLNQSLSLDLDLTKELRFSTTGNFYGNFVKNNRFRTPIGGSAKKYGGIIRKTDYDEIVMTFNQLLKYNKSWEDYAMEALLGHETYKEQSGYMKGGKQKIVDPNNTSFRNAAVTTDLDSYDRTYAVEGYFGQVNANYKQKYFVSASLRRDASSVFAPENRWGTFWSVGGSWLVSSEKFLEKVHFINSLKLKASYGVQGNDYIYLPGEDSGRSYTPYMSLYEISSDGKNPGLKPQYKGNRAITWEESGNFNVGVETTFWDNRIDLDVDFFYKKTNNLLFNMPIPASTGFTTEPRNVADMKNQGVELTLGVTPVKTDNFSWKLTFNGLHYKNEITRLPEELREKGVSRSRKYQILKEGGSIYDFYMVKWGGVNPDNGDAQYWIKNPATGEFELKPSVAYESVNSVQNVGSAIPDLQGGFGTTFNFYNFELALQFAYQMGGKFFDSQYLGLMHSGTAGHNWHTDIRNRWTPENRNTDVPRLQGNSQNIVAASDRFLIDASYLSLRNVSLAYNFSKEVVEKLRLSQLRYYITADNVWLWSKRKGLDPRVSLDGSNTHAVNSPIRTVSMGLSFTF